MKVYEQVSEKLMVDNNTYLVEGYHRDWNTLPEHTPPEGAVWVVQTYYLNRKVVARGDTKAKALKQLEQYLRYHRKRGYKKAFWNGFFSVFCLKCWMRRFREKCFYLYDLEDHHNGHV